MEKAVKRERRGRHAPEGVDRLLRLPQVLEIFPVSPVSWYRGVKSGRFPQPVHLGPRTTAWRLSDVQKLIARGVVEED